MDVLSEDIKKYIDQSVLCWLATSDENHQPNVSPKEIFNYHNDHIIVANIASPQTVKNIKVNANVCISFIDILVQKGFQIKGTAEIIKSDHEDFKVLEKVILEMTQGKYPFASIARISIKKVKPILAPRYILFPETTEEEQIESAKETYGLNG